MSKGIPITVFTGFLGAGKTTVIASLLAKIPKDYDIVILKNEFGDVKTDSAILEKNYKVAEMTNGCLCCVLVGQMKNALEEIKEKYNPDRIIVETSGSAFPAPISLQIRDLSPIFELDSIVTVIDSINFKGYEDKSYTAKMQAKFTDLIIMNKHELVSEREYDSTLDHVYELNDETPIVKFNPDEGLDPDLIFGLDTKLFSSTSNETIAEHDLNHHTREVDLIQIVIKDSSIEDAQLDYDEFVCFLKTLHSDDFYRVKGFVRLSKEKEANSTYVLNYAFGRYTIEKFEDNGELPIVKIIAMGEFEQRHFDLFTSGFKKLNPKESDIEYHKSKKN